MSEKQESWIEILRRRFKGEIHTDIMTRSAYATDASAYMELPEAVLFPVDERDVIALIGLAEEFRLSIIPRGVGTSLAGQVVGNGVVVDVSRYMKNIVAIYPSIGMAIVEPGVVLDELNRELKKHGMFFAPETSTSNRCTIGGMVGNNSCGSHSLKYGSTRDHLISVRAVLHDGSVTEFGPISPERACFTANTLTTEGRIYHTLISMLMDDEKRRIIESVYPSSKLRRRNCGYALDELLFNNLFNMYAPERFNISMLIAGSEGTLCFITQITLKIVPLPPEHKALLCVHCSSLDDAIIANRLALRQEPMAVELMDDNILRLSEKNISQRNNRFFIEGNPAAVLIVEFAEESEEKLQAKINQLVLEIQRTELGYAFPVVRGEDMVKVWALRKAGLGLLSNMPGKAKPMSVIEDTAVPPEHLLDYIHDFKDMLNRHGLSCVFHAHIGSGELHMRPVLDLRKDEDVKKFRAIAEETAELVKKYHGSLSGEHGDGRLRSEYIPVMYGLIVYSWFREVKKAFDPCNIFNPGKIVNAVEMDQSLRYKDCPKAEKIKTYFDFSKQENLLAAVERCNGVADCRKPSMQGGTMCPAFKATGKETDSTRARANLLRLTLYNRGRWWFLSNDVKKVMKKCLSCKACKSECPSNVDMARLKAEYLQHRHNMLGVPLQSIIEAFVPKMYAAMTWVSKIYNFIVSNQVTSLLIKIFMGYHDERELPKVCSTTLKRWYRRKGKHNEKEGRRKVYLFADEFTNTTDVEVGQDFILLLEELGYEVIIPKHSESGRIAISNGMLKRARRIAKRNVNALYDIVTEEVPLVGIEPSSILTFRDEYPDLLRKEMQRKARELSKNVYLYDEFIMREVREGRIKQSDFTDRKCHILLHGHCHQKTLASVDASKKMLELPKNYTCEKLATGCCGMAGSYGMKFMNYHFSKRIGEHVLFPAVRSADANTLIAAPGTSCRMQIWEGTRRRALHPIQILYKALNKKDNVTSER